LVRQLADHKAAIDPAELKTPALREYAVICGRILAKAHARTGDGAALYGYCGDSGKLDKAISKFALTYADQTTRDHEVFVKAIKSGKIKAAV
jgi:predicted alpha/beta hydrolase